MKGLIVTTTTADAPSQRGDALVANGIALVLGTAAFSVSFTHVMRVASEHGQGGWVAKAIATSVELMALASVAEIRRRKSRGEPVWVAVGVLLLGVAMSLASNLATAAPGAWGKTMAAWPAVAFLAVATLVESRTSGPAADAQSSRTDGAARTGQVADIRTQAARPAAPGPYDVLRTQDAPRTAARAEDVRAQSAREPQTRTEPTRTEQTRAAEVVADEAPVSVADQVPAVVDQPAAPTVATQDADEPQDAVPVQDAPAPGAATAPAVLVTVPALTKLTSADTPDSSSDNALATASGGSASLVAAAATAAEPAPANGWLPGSSGLLLPATYAAGTERLELIVPGRPAPAPGPRSQAPASARTDQTRPRTAVRSQGRTERGARPRTDSATRTEEARTQAPRTDRPTRTAVVAELVREIRTDAEWRPDYKALEARTGYKRSFLEKCVGDARRQAVAAV
jgi:Protein of unknown function (DUF2637)